MNYLKNRNLIGQLLLFLATIIWGTSFIVLKNTISDLPPIYVISIRFLSCGIILSLIFFKRIIKISKETLFRGGLLGIYLALAYVFQTLGLNLTTAGRNAFLTSVYCVICPFLAWILIKEKPKSYHLLGVFLCIIGIAFISILGKEGENGNGVLAGDILTLVCTIFFALQVVTISQYRQYNDDNLLLLIIQFFVVGISCGLYSLIFEVPKFGIQSFVIKADQIFNIVYLMVACTFIAQALQIFGLKLSTSASQSAIVLSFEAVFGVFFSVVIGNEKLTPMLVIGFALVFIAILVSELKLDPIKLFKRNNKDKF